MDAAQNVLAGLESAILVDDDPQRAVDLFLEDVSAMCALTNPDARAGMSPLDAPR